MGKIRDFFTNDGNLKAITFGLMVGTSLMALISVIAFAEHDWNGTRVVADFFGFNDIKQCALTNLAFAFAGAVLYWAECHRVQHKCMERLIELQNEKVDCYCRYIEKMTSVISAAGKRNAEKTPEEKK